MSKRSNPELDTGLWLRAKEIFGDLADLAPEERATQTAIACEGDAALLAEVERLVALDDQSSIYFAGLEKAINPEEIPPEQIGVYRVIREIGRGGMGVVYLGERCDGQFEHSVAIKVVQDAGGGRLIERFHNERSILAQLEHPGIAHLLDGGTLPDGRPYFIMEYVGGEPITEYADRKCLDVERRLDLFRTVCAAVSYAHRNLVVHRDLKPGNILIETDRDDERRVKLLDFGISTIIEEGISEAAATSPGEPSTTVGAHLSVAARHLTQYGDRLLTPLYAAPEQLRGQPATTSVDIYALGVLLHELLTGSIPFADKVATREEMERAILETEPDEPSKVAREVEPRIAAARASTPRRLARSLQGDLDSIVLKALKKQPEMRYASVDQLSNDLKRFLRGRVVSARRGGWLHRTKLFLRRHPLAAAATVAVVLTGISLGIFHVDRITHERDLARAETAKAEAIRDLVVGMFDSVEPTQARGRQVTVREVMDSASGDLEKRLAGQPALEAEMSHILGGIYANLGDYEFGRTLQSRGLELRRELYGPRHLDVSESLSGLGLIARLENRYGDAEGLLREALAQQLEFLGPDHLEVAETRHRLAIVLQHANKLEESESMFRQSLKVLRAHLSENHPAVMELRNSLASLLRDRGRYEAAEVMFHEVLAARRRTLGPIDPRTADTLGSLASMLVLQKRFVEAEPLARESLEQRLALFDDTHPDVAVALNVVAGTLRGQDRYEEAAPFYRDSLAIARSNFGNNHPAVAATLNNLAALYKDQGEFARAEPLNRESISIYSETLGKDHSSTSISIGNLGVLLMAMDSFEAAETQFREALRIREHAYPGGHWAIELARSQLGEALARQGRVTEAEPLLKQAHASLVQFLGAQDKRTLEALERLGDLSELSELSEQ